MGWENYQYKKSEHVEAVPGNYRCMIMNAEQGVSKTSGKNMLILTLRPSGTAVNVKAYIVDNEWFDDNLSEFLDAFPQLKENFALNTCYSWRGALGAAKFVVDEKGYLKTGKYPWISAEKQEKLPPFEWKSRSDVYEEMPEYTGFTGLEQNGDEMDLPF